MVSMDLGLRNSGYAKVTIPNEFECEFRKNRITRSTMIEPVARHLDRLIVEKSFVAGSQHVFSGRCVESVAHEYEKFPKAYSAARCVRERHVCNKRHSRISHSCLAFSARLANFPARVEFQCLLNNFSN